VATSILEKHRGALRAKYYSSHAGSFFGRRKHGIVGARKKSPKRSSSLSREQHKARDIRANERRTSQNIVFHRQKESFEIRPTERSRSRRLGTRNFRVDKSAINGIRRETAVESRRVIQRRVRRFYSFEDEYKFLKIVDTFKVLNFVQLFLQNLFYNH